MGELSVRTGEVSISGSIEYVQYTSRAKNRGRLFSKGWRADAGAGDAGVGRADLFLPWGWAHGCAGLHAAARRFGGARWAVFTCDALAAFGALLAMAAPPSAFFMRACPAGTRCAAWPRPFLALRALLAARRGACARCCCALHGTPAARWPGWRGGAARPKAALLRRAKPRGKAPAPCRHKKTRQPPTKQLQKRARVLYNSK